MDARDGVGQTQVELKNVLFFEGSSTDVLLIEGNLPGKDTSAIAISIVSNSRLLGEGLLALLSPHLRVLLIGTYSGEFRISLPLPNPEGHVVLLDSSVGHPEAIAWTRHWRGLVPPALVLILELANDNGLILACIEAGANGYTLQGASAVEVAEAIKDVRNGISRCSPEITAQLYARVALLRTAVVKLSISPLTKRESEILHHIASGYTNLEISAHLVIELRTVKQHVHNILGKLNSHSRAEAVRFAAAQGWLGENAAPPLHRE